MAQPIKTWTNLYPILRVAWSRGRSLSYFRRARIAHAQDRRYDYSHDDDAPRRPRDLERDDEDGERGTAGEHHHFDQGSDTKEKHDRSSGEQNSFLPPRSPADSSKVSSVRRRTRRRPRGGGGRRLLQPVSLSSERRQSIAAVRLSLRPPFRPHCAGCRDGGGQRVGRSFCSLAQPHRTGVCAATRDGACRGVCHPLRPRSLPPSGRCCLSPLSPPSITAAEAVPR